MTPERKNGDENLAATNARMTNQMLTGYHEMGIPTDSLALIHMLNHKDPEMREMGAQLCGLDEKSPARKLGAALGKLED